MRLLRRPWKWLGPAALALVIATSGCKGGAPSTSDHARATCGEGNVAYVDADDGQFLCKPMPPAWIDQDDGGD